MRTDELRRRQRAPVNDRTSVALPSIGFSRCVRWADRVSSGVDNHLPGVYMLAHFGAVPLGQADPLAKEIVYVGETTTLARRWRQFDRAASTRKGRHTAGRAYFSEFGGVRDDLCVSASQ
jgi:hypothetical protein